MTDDCWILREERFSTEQNRAWEGLFTLGSGPLHVRGSLEESLNCAPQNVDYMRMPGNVTAEQFPDTPARHGTFVPGVYAPHPMLGREMVNLPWFNDLRIEVGGEKLDMEDSAVEDYGRELDMRTATLSRRLTWTPAAGGVVSVSFERFLSAVHPHLSMQRAALRADRAMDVTIRAGIDTDVRTSGYDHLEECSFRQIGDVGLHCEVRTNGGNRITIQQEMRSPDIPWFCEQTDRRAELAGVLHLSAGSEVVVEKRVALCTDRDLAPADCADVLAAVAGRSYENLHTEHADAWRQRWESCDIEIVGDDRTQRALRANIYHLLRCHVPGDSRVAIDAKGYAGDAYFGHFFWDTEMYLLPFYLYTDPERARTFVEYRAGTLDGARRNAAAYGYPGARYSWEGDDTGDERCVPWEYRDHEVHITADVVYGWQHFAAAGDPAFLEARVAEAVVETARYWYARLDWRKGEDRPSLLGVMGPDEYTMLSSNNAFTNWLVARNLQLAAELGELGGATRQERRDFAEAAEGLSIPREGPLILQCEEFPGYAEPDFEHQWPGRMGCYAQAVTQERLYRTKCLKQADVLMLMMLFPEAFTDQEVQTAWDYYVPYTTHDSSLSAGIHAIIALRLGMEEEAYEFFQKGLYKDVDTTGDGAAEGIHIAGCGCNWMVMVYGFAGMKSALQSESLSLHPRLPAEWQQVRFPLTWQGIPVSVTMEKQQCIIENRGDAVLAAEVCGVARDVQPGQTERWHRA